VNEEETIKLMASSKSEREWNANCDIVKGRHGGYPEYWYRAIMIGGVYDRTRAGWK
jgi:hypothetical protein